MDQYKLQYEKGSGTFSVVFTALSLKTSKHVAIKCMKKKFESVEKVKKLKEIQALNILSSNEHIIKMIEALYDEPSGTNKAILGKLALVFELMDMNLYECLKCKKNPLTYQKIKLYMFQVMKAIQFMHRKGIFHRDIKPQNILVKGNLVKVADLGSCKGKHSEPPYTDYISTRWYRAPECLMTDGYYNEKMDIWGYGCVLFELITKKPLFPGKDELDQVYRINNILGTPKSELLEKFKSQASHMEINFQQKKGIGIQKFLPSGCPNDLKDLLNKLLAYDPQQRISAENALKHEYFAQMTSNQIENLTTINNKQLRSTFFTMKQSQIPMIQKTEEEQNQTSVKKKILSKQKNYGSKHNLEKGEQGTLPKINGISNNSNIMEGGYKKTFYTKKHSNDFNFTILQGKRAV